MDIRNNSTGITNTTAVTTPTEQTNIANKNKRYTTTKISSESHQANINLEDVVICTNNEKQKQQVIDFYNSEYSANTVVKLDHNNYLNDNDLLNLITCKQTGNLEVTTGRLFTDEPLLLIIDLTNMSSGEIARLNDLLSIPATYNGKAVSKSVNIAIIIDNKMLQPGTNKPSADLWRRLAKFKFHSSVDSLYTARIASLQQANSSLLNKELLATQVPDATTVSLDEKPTIINFATSNSWQELLFGSLTLDTKGKICFKQGCFADEKNHNIVLQDAPWDDSNFTDALATALRQGGFRANGNWVNLAENLLLSKSFTTEQQLTDLTKKHVMQAKDIANLNNKQVAIINSSNFDNVLENNQLHQGVVIAANVLANLTIDCKYILVTDQLTDNQWLKLLTRVSKLNPAPSIIYASNSTDATIKNLMQGSVNKQLEYKTYKYKQDALATFNEKTLIYQVTKDTNWLDMWHLVNLTSQKNFTFSQEDTELLTAIQQGKPVAFLGLENNPEILKQFETLFIQPSYLLLNGNKITITNANIAILLPENIKQTKLPKLLQNIEHKQIVDSTIAEETEATEFINKLLKKFRENNVLLPANKKTISKMFFKQLAIEQQQDQAKDLLPIHYRKAAHTVFAKQYRDNPAFYGYLKTQIEFMMPDYFYQQSIDKEALSNWITQNPNANRNLLAKDFWLLARYCSADCFFNVDKNIENFKFAKVQDKEMLDKLANILLCVIEDHQQQHFVEKFELTEYDTQIDIKYYNGFVITAITDAMIIATDKLKTTMPISEAATKLAFNVDDIIHKYPKQQAITEVYYLLTDIFPEDLLQTEFNDLASSLVASKVNIQRKQARKKQRLAQRIKQHPLIFLQGVAGVGKSHMAKAVVANLKKTSFANMPEPEILSLGPETKASDLFGTQQLKETNNDFKTEFVIGKILAWAMNTTNPPLLILDEANLVADGVLSLLTGLMQSPPQISYAGKVYSLSDKHRIIVTGNPPNYDGRNMDAELKSHMLTLHYKTMLDDELAELIIKPALNVDLSADIKAEISNAMLYLYNEYSENIATDLGARDLQDILARINRIISSNNNTIALTQVYSLVWEGFTEILASSLSNKTIQQKIFNNYKANFAIDKIDNSILAARNKKFQDFLNELSYQNPTLNLSSKAVIQLVKDYWLFLDSQTSLQGRRGLWVEGPAGWGKDCILNAVLTLWEQNQVGENKFLHLNANPNQWDKLIDTVKLAMKNGQKLVISELNLLPSRYLEGLFNDVLTGKASPGFMLFATVNPSSYSNRESLSVAFMNRMTQVKLDPISANELYKILLKHYPQKQTMVKWLFGNFLDLSKLLTQQQAPIQLSLANLLETAAKLDNTDYKHWVEIFQQDYGLAMLMIKDKTDALTIQSPATVTTVEAATKANNKQLTTHNKKKTNSSDHIERFDNITKVANLSSTKYFATNKFSTDNYRLKLLKSTVTANGIASKYINIDAEQIDILSASKLTDTRPLKLEKEQLLGTVELELYNDEWTALPGISYHDECIAISHTDLIELGRCQVTRMLVVKLKEGQDSPKKLKLDFIIKPTLISLDDAKVAKNLEAPHQNKYLTELLDKQVFAPDVIANHSIKKLQQIKLITDKKQQIQELIIWARNFDDYMDITSKGSDALIDAIRYQTGACKHRSIVFQVLAEYFGIPTNCISNGIHRFVEFSLDNKQTWINLDLGGGNNLDHNLKITTQQFLDYEEVNDPKSIQPNKNYFNINFGGNKFLLHNKIIQDLPTQPNQLIEYLRFLSNNTDFINYISEFYNKNFFQYVNNTTVVFSEVLPNIFKRMISEKNNFSISNFMYHFFANTYKKFQQGKIPAATAESILCTCLPLLEDNILNTGSLIYVIEYLAQNKKYKDRARKILDNYYAAFKESINLDPNKQRKIAGIPTNIDEAINSIPIVSAKSATLARLLKQVAINTDWSYTSTGKSLNINRLAVRKPAFPINNNQQNNNRNIYIFLGAAEYYNHICNDIFDNYNKINLNKLKDATTFNQIFDAFINWLFKQLSAFEINFLTDSNTDTSITTKLNYDATGHIKFDNTMFTNNFYAQIFHESRQFYDYIISRARDGGGIFFCDLNSDKIKQTFNDSAVLITQEIITECFQEYLELFCDNLNKAQ